MHSFLYPRVSANCKKIKSRIHSKVGGYVGLKDGERSCGGDIVLVNLYVDCNNAGNEIIF